jgi:Ni/Co efflux regulator RcnB
MKRTPTWLAIVSTVIVAGMLATGQALAEKPADAGGGKKAEQGQKAEHGKADKGGGRQDGKGGDAGGQQAQAKGGKDADKGGGHFSDDSRTAVREYFAAEYRSGKCPPGLAKKNNGCMPPGQAKKWSRGQPLPADVVIYELPVELQVRIGVPPVGHKFVRVASDILMIAVGTNMVVDAIEDLGRL